MTTTETIKKFYTSFAKQNFKEMASCYHKEIVFEDAAFGQLKGSQVSAMWEMLLSQAKNPVKVTFSNIEANNQTGSVNWEANYKFGARKRKVRNQVQSHFKFKDGKIIEHIDTFNLWKWSRQALGFGGLFLGWTPFLKRKIQKTTNQRLQNFMNRN